MAELIEFIKKDNFEECTLKLSGSTVVELCRDSLGHIIIYGNLEGMEKARIHSKLYEKNIIFKLDLPEALTVTIASESHVLEAKIEKI